MGDGDLPASPRRPQRSHLTPLLSEHLQLSTPPWSSASTQQNASLNSGKPSKAAATRRLPNRQNRQKVRGKRAPRAIFDTKQEPAGEEKDETFSENSQSSGDFRQPESSCQDRKRAATDTLELSPRSTLSQDKVDKKKSKRGLVHMQKKSSSSLSKMLLEGEQGEVVEFEARNQERQLKRAVSIQTMSASSVSPAPVVPPRLLRYRASEQSISVMAASAPPPEPTLPTVYSSRHPDLNVITPETVVKVLKGEYESRLVGFQLLDCRFPFEFEGGSLHGATSLCDPDVMEEKLFVSTQLETCTRTALIFFCEFSANRAPKMLRHIRNVDRRLHADTYPELYYPELYLIDGGYKNCFETLQHELCAPSADYVRMDDERFTEACRYEFAAWRRRWKPHKTVANCAANLEKGQRQHQDQDRSQLLQGGHNCGENICLDNLPDQSLLRVKVQQQSRRERDHLSDETCHQRFITEHVWKQAHNHLPSDASGKSGKGFDYADPSNTAHLLEPGSISSYGVGFSENSDRFDDEVAVRERGSSSLHQKLLSATAEPVCVTKFVITSHTFRHASLPRTFSLTRAPGHDSAGPGAINA
ncbi:hypothetical protein ON010_g2606 [Phytophthora cinnamomi]|nr:hypothetical protein ON010_g2606 [Phytophthora cinnamomi]